MQELGIGRMAALNCTTEKTLRLYQSRGLLEPARIDADTGYRYYTYDQCSTIDIIKNLQDMGLSLQEIKTVLDSKNLAQFAETLDRQLEDVESEIRRLKLVKHNITDLRKNCQNLIAKPICDQIILEHIEERRMLCFDIYNPRAQQITNHAEPFLTEWEIDLRLTKGQMRDQGIPLSLFRAVGCSIDVKNLLARDYHLKSSFVFIDDSFTEPVQNIRTVPANTYLTLYRDHYTEPDGKNAEYLGLEALLDYADKNGLQVCGDYLGEIIAETPALLYHGREMLFKMEIPVTRL